MKSFKTQIITTILIFVGFSYFPTPIKAEEVVKIAPPCWLTHSDYYNLNLNRAHNHTTGANSGGKAVDFGANGVPALPYAGQSKPLQSCIDDIVVASIDGVFHINAANRVYIQAPNGMSVWYEHIQAISKSEGQQVRVGDVIGKTSIANGFNHIHVDVRSTLDGADRLTYNQSYPVSDPDGDPFYDFNYFSNQWEFAPFPDVKVQGEDLVGDYNGDGRADVVIIDKINYRNYLRVYLSTDSGFVKETWFEKEYLSHEDMWIAGDYTGDGKTDLARIYLDENNRTDIKVFVSNGSLANGGFTKETYWFENEYRTESDLWTAGDFTGDGKIDLLRAYPDENGRTDMKMFVSNGSLANGGFTKETYWFENEYRTSSDIWRTGDFTGDGKTDLARIYPDENNRTDIKVFVSNGSLINGGFTKETYWFENEYRTTFDSWKVGDYTGDGKADLARIYPDENNRTDIKIFVSNGSLANGGFTKETYWFENEYRINGELWLQGDYTGDGKVDLARVYPDENSRTDIKVFVSNGSLANGGFTKETYWFENEYRLNNDRWYLGDFTGDSKVDLSRIYEENQADKLKVFVSTGSLLNGGFIKQIWY